LDNLYNNKRSVGCFVIRLLKVLGKPKRTEKHSSPTQLSHVGAAMSPSWRFENFLGSQKQKDEHIAPLITVKVCLLVHKVKKKP